MAIEKSFNITDLVNNALRDALRERGHINILIAGRSGVGKSTLINAVFQGNLATTGQGRPVTQNIREIKKEGVPLSIFDTRGLEMADFPKTIGEVRSFVSKRAQNADERQHIHVAWVCILEGLDRVEPGEEELVKMLSEHMPVIVVITKARSDCGFRAKVQQILPDAKNVIRVRAIQEQLDEGFVLPPMNLRELVDLTMQVAPEGLKRALTAAQKVDVDLKKTQSNKIVEKAATAAAGVAATPIPFSDAIAIVPIQVAMLAGISATFGLPIDKSFLTTIVGSVITGAGGTFAGRAVVSNLLKFVPGVGSIAGSAIAATTAATLTTAFGKAYIAALVMLYVENNGEPPTPEEVAKAFKKKYS